MDDTVYQQLKDTIMKTITNGIAFSHMSETERTTKEKEIVDFLQSKGYEAFVQDCMILVINKQWDKVLLMELTRNTLYFTPINIEQTPEVVFYVLELVASRYLDSTPFKKNKKKVKKKMVVKKEEIEEDSDEDTEEEPKPPPNFDFL